MRVLDSALFVAVLVSFSGCPSGGDGGTGGGDATGGGSSGTGGGSAGTGGGSAGTGGGSSGTGGGTSGTGGGTTGTGGGTPAGGVGTFVRVGMYDQLFAASPDGTMNMLFNEGAAERVFFGRCSANCQNPASWNPIQLASVSQLNLLSIGAEGLGVDSTGRVHALMAGVPFGSNVNSAVYATCASSCGSAASWTLLDLTPVAIENTINTNRTFMVAPNGALSFLTAGQTNSITARYVSCSSNCGQLASWSAAAVLNGNPLSAVRDAAGVVHIIFDQGTTSMGDSLHYYGKCTSACAMTASWQLSPLGFIYRTGGYTTGFAVTASGKVFLAYNQGMAMASTADNRKLFINSCSGSTCLDLNTWSSFSLGALDEGAPGSWLEAMGESLALASIDQFDLKLRTCETGCSAAAGWSAPIVIDNSTAMNAAIAPASGSSCPTTSESATWWPNKPSIGASSSGVVVGHSPYAIVKCPGSSPVRMPTIGRIISSF